jgi:hypothetical protein
MNDSLRYSLALTLNFDWKMFKRAEVTSCGCQSRLLTQALFVVFQGVLWKIRYTRGGQKFVFPVR